MNIFSRKNKEKRASLPFPKRSGLKHSFRLSSQPSRTGSSFTVYSTDFTVHQTSTEQPSYPPHPSYNYQPGPQPSSGPESRPRPISLVPQGYNLPFESAGAPTQSVRKKPPPKSPLDYERGAYYTIDASTARRDLLARRASLKNADTVNKSLPQIPPTVKERRLLPTRPAPPPIPALSPTIHDVFSDLDYAPSAYSFRSGSSTQLKQNSAPMGSPRVNENMRRFPNEDKEVPKRAERRRLNLTSGLQVTNPNRIPPRSAGRSSAYLPFTNVDNEGHQRTRSEDAPISIPNAFSPPRINPTSDAQMSPSEILIPHVVSPIERREIYGLGDGPGVRSASLDLDVRSNNRASLTNNIGYQQTPPMSLNVTGPSSSERSQDTVHGAAHGITIRDRFSNEGVQRSNTDIPPRGDLATDFMEAPLLNPLDLLQPETNPQGYLIDGNVLDFGDQFNTGSFLNNLSDNSSSLLAKPLERSDSTIVPADEQRKRKVIKELDAQTSKALGKLVDELEKRHMDEAVNAIEKDLAAIEQSYHKLKRTRTLKQQRRIQTDSSIGKISPLDTDLQKLLYIKEYIRQKEREHASIFRVTSPPSPSSDLSKTPPELKIDRVDTMVGSPSQMLSPPTGNLKPAAYPQSFVTPYETDDRPELNAFPEKRVLPYPTQEPNLNLIAEAFQDESELTSKSSSHTGLVEIDYDYSKVDTLPSPLGESLPKAEPDLLLSMKEEIALDDLMDRTLQLDRAETKLAEDTLCSPMFENGGGFLKLSIPDSEAEEEEHDHFDSSEPGPPHRQVSNAASIYLSIATNRRLALAASRSSSRSAQSTSRSTRYASMRTTDSKVSGVTVAETLVGLMAEDRDGNILDETINTTEYSSTSLKDIHLKQCKEIWAFLGIYKWLLKLNTWFPGQTIRRKELIKTIEVLVRHFYPKMPMESALEVTIYIGESLRDNFGAITESEDPESPEGLESMLIITIMKMVQADSGYPSGVLTPLLSCYTKRVHEDVVIADAPHKCFTFCCPQEPPKEIFFGVPALENPWDLKPTWIEYWSIDERELLVIEQRVIVLQSRVYDLIRKEYDFLEKTDYLVNTVGKEFLDCQDMDMYVYPDLKYEIYRKLFGQIPAIRECHEEYLYKPMMKVLMEQGKFIKKGIFELYKNWTLNCFKLYVEYLDNFSDWNFFLKFEREFKKGLQFMKWTSRFPTDRIELDRYLSNQIFYNIVNIKDLLIDIRKSLLQNDSQLPVLDEAIFIVSTFCEKMDQRTGAADVNTIFKNFVWKISPDNFNILFSPNTMHLVAEEEVIRRPTYGLRAAQSYLILFNNSLFLTELDLDHKKYRVVEKPIPIELVSFEIPKSGDQESDLGQNAPDGRKSDNMLKIIHLGQRTTWTVKFLKKSLRALWVDHINKTKQQRVTDHPFNVKFTTVSTDLPISQEWSLLGLPDQEELNRSRSLKYLVTAAPVISASNSYLKYAICPPGLRKIQCSARCEFQGETFYILGTSGDLYIRSNTALWEKVGKFPNVSQIECVPEANSVLLLSERKFLQIQLEDIVKGYKKGAAVSSTKLSNQSVQFFGQGMMKGVRILFYMKVKVSTSVTPHRTFKVLILDSAKHTFRASNMFDKFFSAIDCYDCSTFQNSVILKSEKGFQMLDSELVPVLIPRSLNIKLPTNMQTKEADFFNMMEHRVSTEKPVGSYEVRNGKEVLLVFTTFAVFCNERGFLSQKNILEFNIKCFGASLIDNHLYAVGKNAIEIFDISSGEQDISPKGVITGEDFELLNKEYINNGHLMVLVNKPGENTRLLLELTGSNFGMN